MSGQIWTVRGMAILGALLGLAVGLPKYLRNPTNVDLGAIRRRGRFDNSSYFHVLHSQVWFKRGITRGAVAGIGMLLTVYFISGQIVMSLR
ncbi:hypothetical protein FHS21_006347 [Phyllobacterium trifolii]|uniref:Uncharacterized protein n=1 Tax=Phyllobacterium trifolii TaxID=300193 RepID=A0A839ULY5_9HYPH|nr:hypothetical protein [Phyllobacterium trifolii]